MKLAQGASVKAGDEIAQVISPEQDNIVASFMRALADVAGRTAELRVKSRVAQDSLDAARSYMRVAEEAAERVEAMSTATVTFRMELLRERAAARKAVISQEAEVSESAIQLLFLDEFIQQLRAHLQEVERRFAQGKVLAPVGGIVSTGLAHVGQSLVAGTPIAEILDPTDIFVDWYIPNERLIDPRVGNEVFVLFGNRRIPGKIAEILPVSGVFSGTRQLMTRERTATQIARIRLGPNASPPALDSTVYVHMHYTGLTARVADGLIRLFGLY
jgi:multidrug resistance efflux pump